MSRPRRPSFVVGPTKTTKSPTATGAALVFGLDPATAVRSMPAETERSLWGRRHQLPGGVWALRPAAVLSRPVVIIDELDKEPRVTQRACLELLQGDALVAGEASEPIVVTPRRGRVKQRSSRPAAGRIPAGRW